jgi:TRAP-type C4-dicarboxylate transport system permease small subunit
MFIGMSFAIKEGSNLRVDAIIEMLPFSFRRIMMGLVDLLVFAMLIFMFLSSVTAVGNAYMVGNYSTGLKMPLYIIYCSVPIGFGLSIVRYVELYVKKIYRIRKSKIKGKGTLRC